MPLPIVEMPRASTVNVPTSAFNALLQACLQLPSFSKILSAALPRRMPAARRRGGVTGSNAGLSEDGLCTPRCWRRTDARAPPLILLTALALFFIFAGIGVAIVQSRERLRAPRRLAPGPSRPSDSAPERALQDASPTSSPPLNLPPGYNASFGIPVDVWRMYAPPGAAAAALCERTIPANAVRVYFTDAEALGGTPPESFIYEVATIDAYDISTTYCRPSGCEVEYRVPDTGDTLYPPLQYLITTYGNESFMPELQRSLARPIVLPADARLDSAVQYKWLHPTIYERCTQRMNQGMDSGQPPRTEKRALARTVTLENTAEVLVGSLSLTDIDNGTSVNDHGLSFVAEAAVAVPRALIFDWNLCETAARAAFTTCVAAFYLASLEKSDRNRNRLTRRRPRRGSNFDPNAVASLSCGASAAINVGFCFFGISDAPFNPPFNPATLDTNYSWLYSMEDASGLDDSEAASQPLTFARGVSAQQVMDRDYSIKYPPRAVVHIFDVGVDTASQCISKANYVATDELDLNFEQPGADDDDASPPPPGGNFPPCTENCWHGTNVAGIALGYPGGLRCPELGAGIAYSVMWSQIRRRKISLISAVNADYFFRGLAHNSTNRSVVVIKQTSLSVDDSPHCRDMSPSWYPDPATNVAREDLQQKMDSVDVTAAGGPDAFPIIVFANGNQGPYDAAWHAHQQARTVINVQAMGAGWTFPFDSDVPSEVNCRTYAQAGSSMTVSAPLKGNGYAKLSGSQSLSSSSLDLSDTEYIFNIWTANLSQGLNPRPDGGTQDWRESRNGTSYAAPQVSAAIARMTAVASANLSWLDILDVLQRSSIPDPTGTLFSSEMAAFAPPNGAQSATFFGGKAVTWNHAVTPGCGSPGGCQPAPIWHHRFWGWGLLDVEEAVRRVKGRSGFVMSNVLVEPVGSFDVSRSWDPASEWYYTSVNMNCHAKNCDVSVLATVRIGIAQSDLSAIAMTQIFLTSPAGTQALVVDNTPISTPQGTAVGDWRFTLYWIRSLQFWRERAVGGTWQIAIRRLSTSNGQPPLTAPTALKLELTSFDPSVTYDAAEDARDDGVQHGGMFTLSLGSPATSPPLAATRHC